MLSKAPDKIQHLFVLKALSYLSEFYLLGSIYDKLTHSKFSLSFGREKEWEKSVFPI